MFTPVISTAFPACLFILLAYALHQPAALAADKPLNKLFVISGQTYDIGVIDSTQDKLTTRFKLPFAVDQAVLSTTLPSLVIVNNSHRQAAFINTESHKVDAIMSFDFEPRLVALGSQGRRLGLANPENQVIEIIDLKDRRSRFRIKNIKNPGYLLFAKDDQVLYVADQSGIEVSVIDLQERRVTKTIPLTNPNPLPQEGAGITGFTRTPGGLFAFVTHAKTRSLSVLDLSNDEVMKRVNLQSPTSRVYPTTNSQHLVMPSDTNNRISLLSTWSMSETGQLPGVNDLRSITSALLDKILFASSGSDRKMFAFSIAQREQIKSFDLSDEPVQSAASADGTKVYVVLNSGDIVIIDALRMEIKDTIKHVVDRPALLVSATNSSYCH